MTGNHSNSAEMEKVSNTKEHNDHQQRTRRYSINHHGIFEQRKSRKRSKINNARPKKGKTNDFEVSYNDAKKITNNDYDK